jgi:hypothetical protein
MFKPILLALAVVAAIAMGGVAKSASADWGHHHHGHHHGHWHGHHHGHWHGHWDGHWHHRPIVYPPIVIGGYYPARYYYADPYWGPYRPYYGYYGSGVHVSFGW